MTLIGWQTNPENGKNIWIFKNSGGYNWPNNNITFLELPNWQIGSQLSCLRNSYPLTISNQPDKQINCVDKDNDKYCNWGISEEKPSTCPSFCESEKDCDDSNPSLGPFINETNFNCKEICFDSDGGNNRLIKGIATGKLYGSDITNSYTDFCSGGGTITEYYCSNDYVVSNTGGCPVNYSCNDGACTQTCELVNTTCSKTQLKDIIEQDVCNLPPNVKNTKCLLKCQQTIACNGDQTPYFCGTPGLVYYTNGLSVDCEPLQNRLICQCSVSNKFYLKERIKPVP